MPRVPAVLQFDFGVAAPHFAARTIAMIPALIGSGRRGQALMSAASSGASFGAWVSTAPDSAPPGWAKVAIPWDSLGLEDGVRVPPWPFT